MASYLGRAKTAISTALPYIGVALAQRAAKQAAPMAVKELNHWIKRAGIDYRVVTSITKARRKLARIREENMYYTPDELRYLYQKQNQARASPAQQMRSANLYQHQNMPGAGHESYPPMVGPPTFHQAERARLNPGTVYRQHNGTPVTKERYETLRRRATQARGKQYRATPVVVDEGPPPAITPTPRDATIGSVVAENSLRDALGLAPISSSSSSSSLPKIFPKTPKPNIETFPSGGVVYRAPLPYNPDEPFYEQYDFGRNEPAEASESVHIPEEPIITPTPPLAPPAPLPPIGPVTPSPSPYSSLPTPPKSTFDPFAMDSLSKAMRAGGRPVTHRFGVLANMGIKPPSNIAPRGVRPNPADIALAEKTEAEKRKKGKYSKHVPIEL